MTPLGQSAESQIFKSSNCREEMLYHRIERYITPCIVAYIPKARVLSRYMQLQISSKITEFVETYCFLQSSAFGLIVHWSYPLIFIKAG